MKRAYKLAQLIADAHPDRVRLLYQANGITAPVNAKSIMDAYLVFGQPFLVSLSEIVSDVMNTTVGIDGTVSLEFDKLASSQQANTDKANQMASTKSGGGFLNTLTNVFGTARNVLNTVNGAYQSVSGLFGKSSSGSGSGSSQSQQQAQLELQAEMLRLQQEQAAAASANKSKTWLLVAAGLVVAILVVVMVIKKK